MPEPLIAPLPPNLDLDGGVTIRFTAVDPTSGTLVTGVNVSGASIFATSLHGLGDLSFGPFMLVPGPGA